MRVTWLAMLCALGCDAGGGSAAGRAPKPGGPPPLPDDTDTVDGPDGAGDTTGASSPEVLSVCPRDGAEYATIQDAVDAAPDGARIEVCPGVYPEWLVVAGRQLTLVGTEGAEDTLVDGLDAGVALTVSDGAVVQVTGLGFVFGHGDDVGGSVRCTDATLSMEDVEAFGGVATRGGGLGATNCDIDVARLAVSKSTASDRGGGVYLEASTGTVGDSDVEGNRAGYGGGVAVSGGDVTLTANRIVRNDALVEGGGVWLSTQDTRLVDNDIATNTSAGGGGGVFVQEGAGDIVGNHVHENTSGEDGGGLYTRTSAAHLADNHVENNQATGDGGGMRIVDGASSIEGNNVVGNEARGDGGGMKVSDARNELVDNRVEANHAGGSGGGLAIDGDTSHVVGGGLYANVADGTGGGLHVASAPDDVRVEGVRLEGNTAGDCGGGAAAERDDPGAVTFAGVTFVANTAGAGGGLCVRGARVGLSNALVVSNVAERGAGLDLRQGSGEVAFSTIWANVGSAAVELGAGVAVRDSIVGGTQGGAGVRAEGALDWAYNDVWGNDAGGYDGADPTGADGNLAADPAFADPGQGDFRLRAESPCVDAGEPGARDTDGSPADLGAWGGTGTPPQP